MYGDLVVLEIAPLPEVAATYLALVRTVAVVDTFVDLEHAIRIMIILRIFYISKPGRNWIRAVRD